MQHAKHKDQVFLKAQKDGLPIALGYFPVSFAFGIFCVNGGLSAWQALLISMTNLTSAGQLAGVTLMTAGASFVEVALSQLVINLRYALMSLSLSQKTDDSIRTKDRFLISFFITDEIFAVSSEKESIGRRYMYSLAILPYLGWSLGTLCGSLLGEVLPTALVSCLGIAIYGMFIAIIVPAAKKSLPVLGVVLSSVAVSCLIKYTPLSSFISDGFSIIICAILTSAVFALICPIKDDGSDENTENTPFLEELSNE